jgi:hypothetical protein
MHLLTELDERRYFAASFDGGQFPELPKAPFACLVWDHGPTVAADTVREAVARAVLSAGCRYVVCGGASPDAWELTFDMAYVERNLEGELPLVVTTSHEDESVDEVAFYFVRCVAVDDLDLSNFVVLHVGATTANIRASLDDAVRERATDVETLTD